MKINGEDANIEIKAGTYVELCRQWQLGDTIEVDMELTVRVFESPNGSNRLGDNQVAVMRGPIVLARDARTGEDIHMPVELRKAIKKGTALVTLAEEDSVDFPCNVCVKVLTDDGKEITMIDYFSAGSTWDERSEFCSWMRLSNSDCSKIPYGIRREDILKGIEVDDRVRRYMAPTRVVWKTQSDKASVVGEDALIGPCIKQIHFNPTQVCTLSTNGESAGILLDFGVEFHGYVKLFISSVCPERVNLRVRFGESESWQSQVGTRYISDSMRHYSC